MGGQSVIIPVEKSLAKGTLLLDQAVLRVGSRDLEKFFLRPDPTPTDSKTLDGAQPSEVSRGITCPFSQYVLLKWERGGERAANPSVQFSFKISFTNEPDTTSIRSLILTSTARCK